MPLIYLIMPFLYFTTIKDFRLYLLINNSFDLITSLIFIIIFSTSLIMYFDQYFNLS